MVRVIGLCFTHGIGPTEKGPGHWPRKKKGVLGGGVFIYNLGFVCTVYVSY